MAELYVYMEKYGLSVIGELIFIIKSEVRSDELSI